MRVQLVPADTALEFWKTNCEMRVGFSAMVSFIRALFIMSHLNRLPEPGLLGEPKCAHSNRLPEPGLLGEPKCAHCRARKEHAPPARPSREPPGRGRRVGAGNARPPLAQVARQQTKIAGRAEAPECAQCRRARGADARAEPANTSRGVSIAPTRQCVITRQGRRRRAAGPRAGP